MPLEYNGYCLYLRSSGVSMAINLSVPSACTRNQKFPLGRPAAWSMSLRFFDSADRPTACDGMFGHLLLPYHHHLLLPLRYPSTHLLAMHSFLIYKAVDIFGLSHLASMSLQDGRSDGGVEFLGAVNQRDKFSSLPVELLEMVSALGYPSAVLAEAHIPRSS